MPVTGRKKCLVLVFMAFLLLFLSGASAEETNENLLYNGDFEILGKDGLPDGWYTDAYLMDPGYSTYQSAEGMDGNESHAAAIHNIALNDARFAQTVNVEPDSLYCLSGYILADAVTGGHGANLSVEGVYAFSQKEYETEGEWRYIEYYGETGPDQHSLTVFARLGGYSGESKGKAAFDQLTLVKKDAVPSGQTADLWFAHNSYTFDEEDAETEEISDRRETSPAWPYLLAVGVLFILLVSGTVYYYRDGKQEQLLRRADSNDGFRWGPILFLALILRVFISYFVEGYGVDVGCFVSWGYTMAHAGPTGFYQQTSFCDYPPLYMYILGLNSWITGILHTDAGWTRVIFRLFPSLCDIAGCWVLLRFFQNTGTSNRYYRIIVLLLAFNPVTIINSAAWGQMDSVLCLLLICVAVYAMKGNWIAAVSFYVTAVLVKPQALMLGFLGLAFMIIAILKEPRTVVKILIATAVGVLLIVVYILPFGIYQPVGWLIGRYADTLSSYPYATVNTANLYYLVGGNWSGIERAAHPAAAAFLGCACALYGAALYKRHKGLKYIQVDAITAAVFAVWFAVCAIIRANWTFVGTGAMAFAFIMVISMAFRKRDIQFLPYLGALLFVLLYVFGVKMHERYLFPAFLLFGLAWAVRRDRRILYLLVLFSFTVFINEGIVLDNSIRLGASSGHLNTDTVWLADILSVMNICGAVYAVWLAWQILLDREPGPVKKARALLPVRILEKRREIQDYHPDRKLHWTRKDTALLCCVTVVYAALSLTTLGSTKAPQTAWSSSGDEEMIVFDLQENNQDISVLYFAQVSRYDFSLAQSYDGVNWSDEVYAQMDQQQCWKWKYVTQSYEGIDGKRTFFNSTDYILRFNCRYIRLTSRQVGLVLNEIIFRDRNGENVPAVIVSRTGDNPDSALWSDPKALLDEQDTFENLPGLFGTNVTGAAQPSWWNSTYFDEIYHARTGFEFVNGTVPYETSHPPLGKVFISWCIMIFGMTPFGWRFAGALAGILMIPGMYLIGKQLTKKTWAGFLASLFIALDCMHLTQTQIATIDSFPVLFIIFSYFFMLRFLQTDLLRSRMKEILPSLALSGFFMGLSIASKWIGIYSGIGLAILFFWHCIRSICMQNEEDKILVFRRVFNVSLWCLLFFVAVPALVYILSYLPYMAYNTRLKGIGDFLSAVWKAQEGMLGYHSTPGLGMDHPFYSPWWEWPVIGKPMFYATEQYIPANAAVHHSIFCFGNPVIWFGALAALLVLIFRWLQDKHYVIQGEETRWHFAGRSFDVRYMFTFIGLLAQYLPWVLVPRGTYIYHYFASIPFLIVTMILSVMPDREGKDKTGKTIGTVTAVLAGLAFLLFLPYATGMPAPAWWLDIGKKILRIWY